jgi:peptide-methionine (R)-S-oxide reductase
MAKRVEKSEGEWKAELSPEEYKVIRQKGTEPPFTGEYVNTKDQGVYRCRACGTPLFASDTKFDSGSGWPSFYQPLKGENVAEKDDRTHFMHRTEVLCAACDAHLGHVFPDGPRPTGLRYCINSCSLELDKDMDPEGATEE